MTPHVCSPSGKPCTNIKSDKKSSAIAEGRNGGLCEASTNPRRPRTHNLVPGGKSGIFRERYGECMDIRKLLASGLLVGVMTLGAACQWMSPATPTTTPWPTAATPMTYPSREELPFPAKTGEHKAVSPAVVRATAVARPTAAARRPDPTPPYIWIPEYADPFMADKMVNSFPATVVTLCTGIFGGVWSPNDPNSNFWETFDICAVNAQLGFPDPTGVATKGCALESSGCKKYQLRR